MAYGPWQDGVEHEVRFPRERGIYQLDRFTGPDGGRMPAYEVLSDTTFGQGAPLRYVPGEPDYGNTEYNYGGYDYLGHRSDSKMTSYPNEYFHENRVPSLEHLWANTVTRTNEGSGLAIAGPGYEFPVFRNMTNDDTFPAHAASGHVSGGRYDYVLNDSFGLQTDNMRWRFQWVQLNYMPTLDYQWHGLPGNSWPDGAVDVEYDDDDTEYGLLGGDYVGYSLLSEPGSLSGFGDSRPEMFIHQYNDDDVPNQTDWWPWVTDPGSTAPVIGLNPSEVARLEGPHDPDYRYNDVLNTTDTSYTMPDEWFTRFHKADPEDTTPRSVLSFTFITFWTSGRYNLRPPYTWDEEESPVYFYAETSGVEWVLRFRTKRYRWVYPDNVHGRLSPRCTIFPREDSPAHIHPRPTSRQTPGMVGGYI